MLRQISVASLMFLSLTLGWCGARLVCAETDDQSYGNLLPLDNDDDPDAGAVLDPDETDAKLLIEADRVDERQDDTPNNPNDEESDGDAIRDGSSKENSDNASTDEDARAEGEVIHERYPNRAVKIERKVIQDAAGNYVNHGPWKMWDQKGSLVAQGQYDHGERDGVWLRWYRVNESDLLKMAPYNQFAIPLLSRVTFKAGKIDGRWLIQDAKQRKVSEWEFVDGERQGLSTWWYPNGHKMREVEYKHGDIDGQLLEWAPDSHLTVRDRYEEGRKLASRTEKAPAGAKTEGLYLFAKQVEKTPDDWWTGKLATYVKQGKDERHGPWMSWYANGQKQIEGEYNHDVQVGTFVWWYQNGQKALEGTYADGEQNGKWSWWHENGQKSIQGEYLKGHPVGRWIWWGEDGKIARSTEMAQGDGEIVRLPQAPTTKRPAGRLDSKPQPPNIRTLR